MIENEEEQFTNSENEHVKAEILEDSQPIENDKKTEENQIVEKDELKGEGEKENHRFKKSKNQTKKHKFRVLAIVIIAIIIIIALLSTIFAFLNSGKNTILKGISINGLSVEGLTEEEAIAFATEKLNNLDREIELKANGETFVMTQAQIEVQYKIKDAVEKAYKIGRQGNIFQNNFAIINTMIKKTNIEIEITYNEELLEKLIQDINVKIPNGMVDNTYCIEEEKLIITRGKGGQVIDTDSAAKMITENIKTQNSNTIELKTEYRECPEIDIDKIYSEVKTEPQDASYKTNPFEIIPHKNGVDFDLEKARELLQEDKEEYEIDLIITKPKVLTNEIGDEAFPNLLSSFSTKYDETNVSRSKNLKIAMSKLNGVVVMPGEVCSYNKTLGKRTVEEGYQYANGFAAGKVVPMLAGGICQISSTLYDAVLYANLDIVERHNHMFQATYVEPGKDATVVYGSLDFKFKNTRKNPIMIKTKCSGGLAEIKIFGIKEEIEYDIEIITNVLSYTPYNVVYQTDSSLAPGKQRVAQYGLQGCKSITYRIKKLNGQEVSKEVLSTDTYSPLTKIIKKGKDAEPTTPTTSTPETTKPETPPTTTTPETTKPETNTTTTTPETTKPETNTTTTTPETTKPETNTTATTPGNTTQGNTTT